MQATAYSLRLALLGSGFPPRLMPGVMPTTMAYSMMRIPTERPPIITVHASNKPK
jgi:hypothetical protein